MAISIPLPGVGGTLFAGGSTGVPQGGVSPGGMSGPSTGKRSVIQNLDSPHSGLRSSLSKGDPMSRMNNNYGKGHNLLLGMSGHSKAPNQQIRGGTGQMRRIRGGLGPGKVGQAGGSADYSMSSPDVE